MDLISTTPYQDVAEIPDFVYHYTSLESMFAILHGFNKENRCFSFHASNIYNVNDPCEMILAFEVLKKYLPEFEEEKRIPMEKRLSEVFNHDDRETACKDDYLYGRKKKTIDHGTIPYIMSFSKFGDFLPMWNLYGTFGKGVCLKFRVVNILENIADGCFVGSVMYNKTINCLLKDMISCFYKSSVQSASSIDKVFELATLCFCIAPFFKHEDYSYEHEWRIAYEKNYTPEAYNKKQLFAIASTEIVDYVNIPIVSSALEEIIIGPAANFEVISHVLGNELRECGMNPEIIKKSKIYYKQNK